MYAYSKGSIEVLVSVCIIIRHCRPQLWYRSNATSHSLDNTLLTAHSNLTFTILSRQACNSKVALHLVYNKTFIKQGYDHRFPLVCCVEHRVRTRNGTLKQRNLKK